MDFDEYQRLASRTATWSDTQGEEYKLLYVTLGICGESGEIAEKVKKLLRNDGGVISEEKREALKSEIGDVLWYLSQLARELGIPFSDAAAYNIKKLADRAERGVIKSQGDTR